jgi:transcriptional regulator with XRE-family HTH domain
MARTFQIELGKRIRSLREQIGLSQLDIAEHLGINRVTVSQIEKGQRKLSAEETKRLSEVFNITSDGLLDPSKDITVSLEKAWQRRQTHQTAIRISVPQKNVSKFKEVLLYVLKQVGSKPNVGESVLYKLLYFIDFDYYEKYEEQLMGATYIKNRYGPTPKEFAKIVQQMKNKDLIVVETKYFKYPQRKYLPLREPDLSVLNARELSTIDSVLEKLSNKNAADISLYSHNDVPWLTTQDANVIDYESVFYRTPAYSVRSYDEENIQ